MRGGNAPCNGRCRLRGAHRRNRAKGSACPMSEWLQCVSCARKYAISDVRYTCECGGLLAVGRSLLAVRRDVFDQRRVGRRAIDQSGVWRFREAVLDVDESQIVTHPEGNTRMYERDGMLFKHEGENPTGSFKDRGMTVAMTQAVPRGARAVPCASTGNTSAPLAGSAAAATIPPIPFRPTWKHAAGKNNHT